MTIKIDDIEDFDEIQRIKRKEDLIEQTELAIIILKNGLPFQIYVDGSWIDENEEPLYFVSRRVRIRLKKAK